MEVYDPTVEEIAYDEEEQNKVPQRIDQSLLISNHQWLTHPETSPSFQHYVMMNHSPRPDMACIRTITERIAKEGMELWSRICTSRTLFRIPDTLKCDRTFARDSEEVYYLDLMDNWLNGLPKEITINVIPLVKRTLYHRLFYAFSRRPGYFTEHFERRRTKLWLPYDHPENKHCGNGDLSEKYPKVQACLQLVTQPPALPVPVPLVVFYFPTELREAQQRKLQGLSLTERQRRLLFCLDKEYYVLFLAMWWSEARYGGRQFVLPKKTVDTLCEECKEVNLVGIKHAVFILEYMRIASTLSSAYHVWVGFRGNWMEESTTVWAKKGTGIHDPKQTPVRFSYFIDKKSRRLTITGHSTKVYERNTVLYKKLANPDLDKVPGLLQLVVDQNWNLLGDLRVGVLLTNFMNLYTATRSTVDTLVSQGLRGFPSQGGYETDINHNNDYYRNDRYLRGEGHVSRVEYYDQEGHDAQRYREQEVRIRSSRYSPRRPAQVEDRYYGRSEYENYRRGNYDADQYRGEYYGRNERRDDMRPEGYRGLDAQARRGEERDWREPLSPRIPHYTPEKVFELPNNTPNSGARGQPSTTGRNIGRAGAGPSTDPVFKDSGHTGTAMLSRNQPGPGLNDLDPVSPRKQALIEDCIRRNAHTLQPKAPKIYRDPLSAARKRTNPEPGCLEGNGVNGEG